MPGILIALALTRAAAVAAVAVGAALGRARALVAVIARVGAAGLAVAGRYLYATRMGKHRAWAGVLGSFAWRGEERALALGCGRGAVLIAPGCGLPRGHVTGIDIWPTGDQPGKAKGVPHGNAVLEGVADWVAVGTGDIRDFPFQAGSLDVVISGLARHNLRSPADRIQVHQNALRVLKPGGRREPVRDFQTRAKTQQPLTPARAAAANHAGSAAPMAAVSIKQLAGIRVAPLRIPASLQAPSAPYPEISDTRTSAGSAG